MKRLHPGSFWRFLNPEPTPVDHSINTYLLPTDRYLTVNGDEEDAFKLNFIENLKHLQFSENS